MEQPTEDTIRYISLLISGQTIIDAIDNLKDTPYYKGKLKQYGQPFYNQIHKELGKDIVKIWNNDEILAMEMVRSINKIAKLIAQGNSEALVIVDQLLQKDFDFSKYKLVEIE